MNYPHSLHIILFSLLLAILYKPTEIDTVFLKNALTSGSISQPSHVLLLTAHPDDECLFFAPTILSLLSRSRQYSDVHSSTHSTAQAALDVEQAPSLHLYSLCLSTGDADGLGNIRREELGRSLGVLGVDSNKRWVLDHPDLKDNITAQWSPRIIADVLAPYINEHHINIILTFDDKGISSHPNHRSLPEGVKYLLRTYGDTSTEPPKLFTLITLPVVTKYSSILAPLLAKLDLYKLSLITRLESQLARIGRGLGLSIPTTADTSIRPSSQNVMPVFVSGFPEYFTTILAMRAHRSQLVWFRWLYVLFSRYMWVNEWVEIKASA